MTVRTPPLLKPGNRADSPDEALPAGSTLPSRDGARLPRLPHERDESADSQAPSAPTHEEVGRQASADADAGKPPTDRSAESDRTYNENFDRNDELPRR